MHRQLRVIQLRRVQEGLCVEVAWEETRQPVIVTRARGIAKVLALANWPTHFRELYEAGELCIGTGLAMMIILRDGLNSVKFKQVIGTYRRFK